MSRDPIVDEIRAIRDEYARRFAYDLDAIYEDLKRRERESGVETEVLPPRPVEPARTPRRPSES